MKQAGGVQQVGQIGHSRASDALKPGSFNKLIREHAHQPPMICSGIGKPDPEVQRATTFVALCPALPL